MAWQEDAGMAGDAMADMDNEEAIKATEEEQPVTWNGIQDASVPMSNAKKIGLLKKELHEELINWQRNQIHPAQLGIITFYLDNQFWSLIGYLSHIVPNFDAVEFEAIYLERLVANLPEQREALITERERQKLTSGIVGADGQPIA